MSDLLAVANGSRPTPKFVCEHCVEDEHLEQVVRDNAETVACDYCGEGGIDDADEPAVASLDAIVEYMRERIATDWCDPGEELFYDGREGGYQGDVYTAWELFPEIEYEPSDGTLYEDLLAEFCDEWWCRKDYALMRDHERILSGWSAFVSVIKHHRRYTFWTMGDAYGEDPDHPDSVAIGTLLQEIGDWVHAAELIAEVPADTELWRVRVHGAGEEINSGADLGSPPLDRALQPNRMSPDGVSMFYASADLDTACLETVDPNRLDGKVVTGGVFRPTRALRILDLHAVPEVPSFWDPNVRRRSALIFLRQFKRQISRPITRDGIERLDYVPTQAFTEFVRYEMKTVDGQSIDGICYSSSRNDGRCYVIFACHEQCFHEGEAEDGHQLLDLDPASIVRMEPADLEERLRGDAGDREGEEE